MSQPAKAADTRWTGVDMSTPLFRIGSSWDLCNLVSFYVGGLVGGLWLDSPVCKEWNEANLQLPLGILKLKGFQLQVGFVPRSTLELSKPADIKERPFSLSLGEKVGRPPYPPNWRHCPLKPVFHARHVRPPRILDLATPPQHASGTCSVSHAIFVRMPRKSCHANFLPTKVGHTRLACARDSAVLQWRRKESCTNGATTLPRMNLSWYVGHVAIFS